jgi:hypothetical protein
MPLFRRRPLLRAAAVAGGGYLAGKHHAQAEADERAYQAQPMQPAYQQPMQPAPPVQRGITAEDTARLQDLGKLHEQGILSDEEFAQQKATILGTA